LTNQIKTKSEYFVCKLGKGFKCIFFGVLFTITIGVAGNVQAQFGPEYMLSDSLYLNTHSPHKATFYSAILPGLGQIYNQKYWKIPIIYAGFGGLIYYTNYNNYVYNKYKDLYEVRLRIDSGEELEMDPIYANYTAASLKRAKDTWRRYRDLSIIGIGLFYVAQIIDADVDAHFFDYDMSEDLSMRWEPILLDNQIYSLQSGASTTLGLRFSIRF